jgi:hypothetical protein
VFRQRPSGSPQFSDQRPVGANSPANILQSTLRSHRLADPGHDFAVSCTDGGWVPESAQWPETTIDVPVGAIRAFDVLANAPGDWAFHCHKTHHTMNAMGHDVKNFIGVQTRDLARQVRKLVPDYMPMGSDGMAMMAEMEMPMPENTLPMMTGFGQFAPIEMGGMFTLMKIREGLAPNDYKDPGNYQNPQGTVAYEFKGDAAGAPRRGDAPAAQPTNGPTVVKPGTRGVPKGHH